MAVTDIGWTGSPLTHRLVAHRAVRFDEKFTLEAGTYPAGYVLPGFTFNGWKGCEKVSPACKRCYAEAWSKRCGYTPDGKHHLTIWGPARSTPRERTTEEYWRRPLRWNQIAEELGVRLKVFAFSLADVGEDHPHVAPWRDDLFELIDRTPNLTWLLLTKRPAHLASVWPRAWQRRGGTPRNVWVGTTAEDQQYAEERIPTLVGINAAEHFLSLEPLLGPVDLGQWTGAGPRGVDVWLDALDETLVDIRERPGVSWVIVGGESGGGHRVMDLDTVASIAKQCAAAHVPVFVKQDSGQHPGQRGRLPADLWALKQWPRSEGRHG